MCVCVWLLYSGSCPFCSQWHTENRTWHVSFSAKDRKSLFLFQGKEFLFTETTDKKNSLQNNLRFLRYLHIFTVGSLDVLSLVWCMFPVGYFACWVCVFVCVVCVFHGYFLWSQPLWFMTFSVVSDRKVKPWICFFPTLSPSDTQWPCRVVPLPR